MKKLWQENYLLTLSMIILLTISILPLLYEFVLPAPGKVKLFWHNYPYDFNYYRSVMLQGRQGRFLLEDRYTTEPHQPIYARPVYLVFGHLSRLSKVDPAFLYHLSRLFFGMIFLLVIVRFIQGFFPQKEPRLMAYFLALFIGGFPNFSGARRIDQLWTFLPHFTELQITRRITFLPHFLLGHIGLVLLIIWLTEAFQKKKFFLSPRLFFSAGLLGWAGLSHPPSLAFFYPLIIGFGALVGLSKQPRKLKFASLKLAAIILLLLLPFLSYLAISLRQQSWREIYGHRFGLGGSFWHYLLALGPTVFLGLGGMILVLSRIIKKQTISFYHLMAVSWLATSLGLTLLPRWLNFYAETRFSQTAVFLPAAVLGTDLLFFLKQKWLKKNGWQWLAGLSLLLLALTLPPQVNLYQEQFAEIKDYCQQQLGQLPYPPVADYPPQSLTEAIVWLGRSSQARGIVLSQFYAGNLIPAYAGNRVYLGHPSETINFGQKMTAVNQFFSGTMTPQEQLKFLQNNRISYLFYGPQEKALGKLTVDKLPLSVSFKNELVTIFKVHES